jgi:uncharacterized protein (TIGR00369 family)
MMHAQNPDFAKRVAAIFKQAPFVQDLGIELKDCGPGWCETTLIIQEKHFQQDQVIHAGVQATLADHTAGAAGGTLIKDNEIILTVEFKINLLKAARGQDLVCRAGVIKPGRNLTVVESSVQALQDGKSYLVSKAMVTLAVVPA